MISLLFLAYLIKIQKEQDKEFRSYIENIGTPTKVDPNVFHNKAEQFWKGF